MARLRKSDILRDVDHDGAGQFDYNTVIYTRPNGDIVIRLYRTDICWKTPEGKVHVFAGNFRTVTTKDRINKALEFFGIKLKVSQMDFTWYLSDGREFIDDMAVN